MQNPNDSKFIAIADAINQLSDSIEETQNVVEQIHGNVGDSFDGVKSKVDKLSIRLKQIKESILNEDDVLSIVSNEVEKVNNQLKNVKDKSEQNIKDSLFKVRQIVGSGITTLLKATDLDSTNLTNGFVIAWDSTLQRFKLVAQTGGGGAVSSVNTLTGAVVLTTANITDSVNKRYVTDSNLTSIANNTGDNATNTQYSGLVSNATHTGDVTGSTALTIANSAVTNVKMADMLTKTYKGRTSATTGVVEDVPVATLKTDLVLNNVDNTSDINKPISTATQTALNAKFTLPALTSGSILFSNGTTISQDNANLFWDITKKGLGVGSFLGASDGRMRIGGNISSAGRGSLGAYFTMDNSNTATDTTSTGTVSLANGMALFGTAFASTSATTYSDASTLYIAGPASASTNVTITRAWSLYVSSGNTKLSGGVILGAYIQFSTSNQIIYDSNANEYLKFTTVASAVNELTIANAVTTTGPILSATGGDANIDINLTPKGTGLIRGTTATTTDNSTALATTAFVQLNKIGYNLQYVSTTGFAVVNSTTLFFNGVFVSSSYPGGVVASKTGTIKSVFIKVRVTGTLGTSETGSFYIRINNTTDVLITSVAKFDATTQSYNLTGMSTSVTEGDDIVIKYVGPVFTTNPTGNQLSASILIE